jgi:hypothetical protein
MNQKSRLLVMASLAAVSSFASATDCSGIADTSGNRASFPQCFTATDKSTTATQITATSIQQIGTISQAVSGRMLAIGVGGPQQKTAAAGEITGLAAAGNPKPYNVWGNLGESDTTYKGNNGAANADKYRAVVDNVVVGLDYSFAPNMVAGLSVAYDRGNGATGLNATATSSKGTTYAPYFGWQLNKVLALDASAGFGGGEFVSNQRTSDTKRSFYAANLSYSDWKDNLQLLGKVGYLQAEEKYGDFSGMFNSSSISKMGQFRVGGEVGYWMNGSMPFAGLSWLTEDRSGSNASGIADNSKLGKSAYVATFGVNFFSLSSGVTGGLRYTQEFGRDNGKSNNLSANISMKF